MDDNVMKKVVYVTLVLTNTVVYMAAIAQILIGSCNCEQILALVARENYVLAYKLLPFNKAIER